MKLFFAITFTLFLLANTLIDEKTNYYDHMRNEKIMKEIAEYNTLTLNDHPYIQNPPVYYLTYGLFSKITGANDTAYQTIETAIYYIGCLLAYLLAKKMMGTKKAVLLFIILLTDSLFLNVNKVDFTGIILLHTILLLITTILYKPTIKYDILFGLLTGISMLVKSTFLFINIPLFLYLFIAKTKIKHLITILLISLIIYSPWIIYLKLNNFPLIPNLDHIIGTVIGPEKRTILDPIIYMIKEWPLQIILPLLFLLKNKKIKQNLPFLLILITTPALTAIILKKWTAEGLIPIFVTGTILLLRNIPENKKTIAFLILLLISERIIDYSNTEYTLFNKTKYNTCELYTNFLKNTNNITVLSDHDGITPNILYNINSEKLVETEQGYIKALLFNADYIITTNDYEYLKSAAFEKINTYNCDKNYTVYKVNMDKLAQEIGLEDKTEITVTDGEKGIRATIRIYGNGLNYIYKTNNNGNITVYTQKYGIYNIEIVRAGYRTIKTTILTGGRKNYDMKRKYSLVTDDKIMSY